MADTDEWVSLATDLLEREKEEAELIILSQKTSEADACRSSASEEGDNFAESGSVADEYVASDVPLEPCAADSFWVQLLKSSTKHCKPGGVSSSTSVGVLAHALDVLQKALPSRPGRELWLGAHLYRTIDTLDPTPPRPPP